jgi:uncharacterized phage protein (TIGR01671 family)
MEVYGIQWPINEDPMLLLLDSEDSVFENVIAWHDARTCELMQWTGLVDKNNTPIFEGDIIKLDEKFMTHKGTYRQYCLVGFKDGAFMFGRSPFNPWGMESYLWHCAKCKDLEGKAMDSLCEVVGNIYENETLLEIDGHTIKEMKQQCNEFNAMFPEFSHEFHKELLN